MHKMKDMPYIIGIKMRIYPSNEQKDIIAVNDGAGRFVYNRLVARDRELFSLRRVKCFLKPVADRMDYLLSLGGKSSDLKAAYPFLEDKRIDAQTIANAVKNYHTAWSNFTKVPGTSMPAFHKKGYEKQYQTNAHYPSGASRISDGNVYLADDRHIMLPKLGCVRFKGSRKIRRIFSRTCETRIGTITVSMDACGAYYVSLQTGSVYPFHRKLRRTGHSIGIDVNIGNFCTDSDGVVTDNPKYRRSTKERLAKEQRRLSRMAARAREEKRPLSESRNYQKQRLKVAKLHRHAAAQNEAFQHRLSRSMINNQDRVFAEDLKVRNLMKNHRLAAAIADCSWDSFLRKLDYKAGFYGRVFMKVPPKNTTQMCSVCGHIMSGDRKLTLDVREWVCPQCGTRHLRDRNAAINIKNRGLGLLGIS